MYIAYLDEFGHIGPFTGRDQEKFNESPLFGLGGIVLPATEVRGFATWFFQVKANLLAWEIRHSGEAPYTWEKKGAQLYTTKNVLKYTELRKATNRLLNQIDKIGGQCVYVGLEKYSTPEDHDAKSLYLAVLRETIKRIDQFSERKADQWLLIVDEQEKSQFRKQIVATASAEMFGPSRRIRLIEPPIQAESHLYQTLQCADWICGLVGRLGAYVCQPDQYPELARLDWKVLSNAFEWVSAIFIVSKKTWIKPDRWTPRRQDLRSRDVITQPVLDRATAPKCLNSGCRLESRHA